MLDSDPRVEALAIALHDEDNFSTGWINLHENDKNHERNRAKNLIAIIDGVDPIRNYIKDKFNGTE